jgi:DMSO reductase anchor subunit
MEKYELPLVIFTVLSQMSVGITLILTLRVLQGKLESKRLYWLVSGWFWRRRPWRYCTLRIRIAPMTLINLQHAWLSREILGATLYGAAVG